MKWIVFVASLVAAVSSFTTTPVIANDVADVVRARANARAGGGTSGHDAWVLQRHGKLSGTGSSSKSWKAKKAAKARALRAAKKRKAAKRRAYLAAKKKKAAERRARIAAKKKKQEEARRRAIAAAEKKEKARRKALAAAEKKEAERKRKLAAEKAEQEKIAAAKPNQEKDTAPQAKGTGEKSEGAFISAPSTAVLMTSQDIRPDPAPAKLGKAGDTTSVATTKNGASTVTTTAATAGPAPTEKKVSVKAESNAEGCKKFLPAIGLTVSVGC